MLLHPTPARVPAGSAPRSDTRDFDRLRVRSFPSGHSRLSADHGRSAHPLLLIWLRDAGVLRQKGRTVEADTGGLCFLPNDAPVWLCDVGPAGAIALELPTEVEARARAYLTTALGDVIATETGAAACLRGFLDALDHQPATYRPDYPGWVQTCVVEMIERVLAECVGARPTPGERAMLAARDHVMTHLMDPGLTPHRVAREAAVSLRTLNRLFAAEGDTVGGCIRRHRLERCRADLVDPGKTDRSIGQIGALWCFPDAAHFSRVFKDAYGCSPRAYRAEARRRRTEVDDVA